MTRGTSVQRSVDKKGLLLEVELLREAHLGQHIQIVVQSGEIRLLPAGEEENWREILDDLAGCLGTERVEDYDWFLSDIK